MAHSNKSKIIIISYLVLILVISSLDGQSISEYSFFINDKVFHFVEYFILGWMLYKFISTAKNTMKFMLFVNIFILLFPVFDEFWQQLITTNRHFDVMDISYNILGTYAGIFYMKINNV